MLRPLLASLVAVAVAGPGIALAAGPRAALVEFRTEGEIAPAVREKLSVGLHDGLGAGLTLMSLDKVNGAVLDANPSLAECREATCRKALGQTLGLRVLVMASAGSEMEFYHLRLSAMDAATGRILLTSSATCEICTLIEATKTLKDEASRFSADLSPLASSLPRPKPTRTVLLPPKEPKTAARADAAEFPEAPGAPLAATQFPGPTPGQRAASTAGLPPVPGPDPTPPGPGDPPPSTDEFPYGDVAFGALAGGLALLGTGGVLIARDGDSTCDNQPLQKCPTVYDTGQAGLVTVVLGGVGLLTSVVLFLLQQAATGVGPETPPRLPRLPGAPLELTW